MRRRELLGGLVGAAATWPLAHAQQRALPLIGLVRITTAEDSAHLLAAFRRGLGELGYIEGQNVAIEYRYALGQVDRLPALMTELLERRVTVLAATGGTISARAAKAATMTVPVVFTTGDDPVKVGLLQRRAFIAGLSAAVWPLAARAQTYPNGPVKLITQGAAGSGPDVIARVFGDALGRHWGQQVLVLNHPGAGGTTAARAAAGAPSDGYTLYMPATSAFIVMPEMFPNLPVKLDRDFAPIGFVGEQPMIIAAASSLNAKTLPELVALSKQRPGQLFYSANARGTLPHLTAERFREASGADLTYIPYPGAAAGLQDMIGGRIQIIIEGPSALAGAIKSGAIRPLAVASAERVSEFPGVPTVGETVPGFTAMGWFPLMAPMETPQPIIEKISADLRVVLAQPELQKRFLDLGTFVRPMSPQEVGAFIQHERSVWQPVVRRIGFGNN